MPGLFRVLPTTPEKTLPVAEKDKTGSSSGVKLGGMMTPNAHGCDPQPPKAIIVERTVRDLFSQSSIQA